MQAVIRISGAQYLVSEGQELTVDRITATQPDSKLRLEALMAISDSEVQIGQPVLQNIIVQAEKLSEKKGDKIRVFKYKAKSRYRKTTGFRASLTVLKILSITDSTLSPKEHSVVTSKKSKKPSLKSEKKS